MGETAFSVAVKHEQRPLQVITDTQTLSQSGKGWCALLLLTVPIRLT